MFTVFHNRASDILRGSKQWWTLASKISRGSGPSNPRWIDAYASVVLTVEPVVISIPSTEFRYIIFDRLSYRATAYSICLARYTIAHPSVCLSVCLSHGWISQKRLKLGL